MKRKITDLERKLINDGWCLALKRYSGKHSDKTLCYEYHKTSDLRNNGKTYEQIIKLDQKRSQIVDYGIRNVVIDFLNDQELCLVRFLFLELRHYVERLVSENKDLQKLANEIKDTVENIIIEETGINLKSNVNIPNSELDERQELPPMNDEQFDELCKEMENENKV